MKLNLALSLLACLSCFSSTGQSQSPSRAGRTVAPTRLTLAQSDAENANAEDTSLPADLSQIPPDRRVHAYVDGVHQIMEIDDARSRGLTIVDLSDDWVPYIFWPKTPEKDDYKENDYLDDYVDLANDRIDVDGVALSKYEHNYLEVYGIPPSLSVLRKRFLEDEEKECYKSLDYDLFKDYQGAIRTVDPASSEKEYKRYQAARASYLQAKRAAKVKNLEELLKVPEYQKVAETYQKLKWKIQAINELQHRMACEGMYQRKKVPKEKPGIFSPALHQALRTFEQKNNIYGWGMILKHTAAALSHTPLENNYESLKRVFTERVVSAASILEDGSISRSTYKTSDGGRRQRIRNLVAEFSEAIVQQMGLNSPEQALQFFKEHDEKEFEYFFVAVKLPSLPEYYSSRMDLSVIIDRGDVWYDFPFDTQGKRQAQPRRRLPFLTLYTNYRGQQIPLVRWQTTIGGWQPEMRHDQEYYKYKISDVGPRIWKNIIAGPVWIPPPNTPSRDMVKVRPVRSKVEPIVAYQAFGPGYASAYGLVAAFHITKSGQDNQVRTHGSVNYMSIMSSYSHGCHRLFNYRAVRLFSFVLSHRNFERKGQTKLGYTYRFEHKGEEFQIEMRTRGYYYEIKPPVSVMVLEGNIKGDTKEPITEYVKKPTLIYQEDLPSLQKNLSGAPKARKKDQRNNNIMVEPQNL